MARREDVAHLYLMLRGARDGTREGRKIKKRGSGDMGAFLIEHLSPFLSLPAGKFPNFRYRKAPDSLL